MADSGIKNVRIFRSNLPTVALNGDYLIRYRIVSEDKNKTSHWSQIYSITNTYVDADNIIYLDGGEES